GATHAVAVGVVTISHPSSTNDTPPDRHHPPGHRENRLHDHHSPPARPPRPTTRGRSPRTARGAGRPRGPAQEPHRGREAVGPAGRGRSGGVRRGRRVLRGGPGDRGDPVRRVLLHVVRADPAPHAGENAGG